MKVFRFAYALAFYLAWAGTLPAFQGEKHAQASLLSELAEFAPGQDLTVGLRIQHDPHWHTYWKEPGDVGLPTEIEWQLPKGVTAGPILWPKPKTYSDPGGLKAFGYEGDLLLFTVLKVSKDFSLSTLVLKAKATWLICAEICIPGGQDVSLDLPKADVPRVSASAALFAQFRPSLGLGPDDAAPGAGSSQNLAYMLLFAFIGGLILNLMPCVLPVLSLKVVSLVRQSGESRRRSTALGAAFSLGTLSSFWIMAGAVVALKGAGQAVGWGFQFQSPWFVVFMASVVTLFALNLFGVFELSLPSGAATGIHEASGREGLPGAMLTGAFMTLMATPCTAPFLGPALGFAFTQNAPTLFAVFTAVGLGLAAPYQVFSSFPALMRFVPKAGKWMNHFKQLMGFLMLATNLWLLWVLGHQTGLEVVIWAAAFLMALGLASWIYGVYAPMGSSWTRLIVVGLFNLVLVGGALKGLLWEPLNFNPGHEGHDTYLSRGGWEPYDAVKLEQYKKDKRTVFIDFTAEWCWTCKVNEKAVLESDAVEKAFQAGKVIKIKADWTRRSAEITNLIQSFGRSGVPLYVVYLNGGAPKVLPEVITQGLVLEALGRIQ